MAVNNGLPFPVFLSPHQRGHAAPGSPESVERIDRLVEAILGFGLAPQEPDDFGLRPIAAIHSNEFLTFLQNAYLRFAQLKEGPRPAIPDSFAVRELGGPIPRSIWGQLGHYCSDNLSPIAEHTWQAAYWSAQTGLAAAKAVDHGAPLAYALCRPPGHHAYRDLYGGYCYLNNAAIAAQWLSARGRRVAILDIDYHHGNGTQAIFYQRPDVFFCSIHADPEDEYPYYCGYEAEWGDGEGRGTTLNIALPVGANEDLYFAALDRGLRAVDAFGAGVILVSLGFDTIEGDPQGGFLLQPDSFAHIGHRLSDLRRPMLLVQEGGYLLGALQPALTALIDGLLAE